MLHTQLRDAQPTKQLGTSKKGSNRMTTGSTRKARSGKGPAASLSFVPICLIGQAKSGEHAGLPVTCKSLFGKESR